MDTTSQTSVEARRSFLKKVAYVAPAVVALGTLTAPVSAEAKHMSAMYVKSDDVTWKVTYEDTTNQVKTATKTKVVEKPNKTTIITDNYTRDEVLADNSLLKKFKNWFGIKFV